MTEILLFLAGAFLGFIAGWLVARKWNAKVEMELRKKLVQLEDIAGI